MIRKKAGPKPPRSGIPAERLDGDAGRPQGSLIIRDMMLQGARTYKTPLECYEGIATNVLASACVAYEIITTKPIHPTTAR